tara:strand:+ start:2213 stop:2875 length:663 start_codon:yes stop_codon:yes gene_type:complete
MSQEHRKRIIRNAFEDDETKRRIEEAVKYTRSTGNECGFITSVDYFDPELSIYNSQLALGNHDSVSLGKRELRDDESYPLLLFHTHPPIDLLFSQFGFDISPADLRNSITEYCWWQSKYSSLYELSQEFPNTITSEVFDIVVPPMSIRISTTSRIELYLMQVHGRLQVTLPDGLPAVFTLQKNKGTIKFSQVEYIPEEKTYVGLDEEYGTFSEPRLNLSD